MNENVANMYDRCLYHRYTPFIYTIHLHHIYHTYMKRNGVSVCMLDVLLSIDSFMHVFMFYIHLYDAYMYIYIYICTQN